MNECCSYCASHKDRIQRLENSYDELDNRVTVLDKEFAVSKTEIWSVVKSLEKLPEAMTQISSTMISIQGEITKSNERMENIETEFYGLKKELIKPDEFEAYKAKLNQIDDEGKFNIRTFIRDNWIKIVFILSVSALIIKELLK